MKRIHFAILCPFVALILAFSGSKNGNKGAYTIEGVSYTPTYLFHHLPDPSSSRPYFDMQGWVSESTTYYGTYYIAIVGNSVPETGTYHLQDFAETGQASLLILTPEPNSKAYRAQSGELHLTNKGGVITATFSNVPVKSDTGNFTSVASGTITIDCTKPEPKK